MTKGRGKDKEFGETALTYAKELALARMGYQFEQLTTWQMEHGIEWEPEARKIYEQSRGEVKLPQFIEFGKFAGATPDGFVGEFGLLEIKCPQERNHINYLIGGPPKQYIYQMQFQMMVCNKKFCDFLTFHPHFPDHLKAKVFRIERDDEITMVFTKRLEPFNEIVEGYVKQLSND